MVTMSDVWDRTTEVLRGRGAMLAQVAGLALFLPSVVRDAVTVFLVPGSVAFALVGGVVTIVVLVLAVWGQLAMLSISTDPATTVGDASRHATARFPAALAVLIVAILAFLVLCIPFGVAIGMSGVDFSGMASTGAIPDIGGGTITFLIIYLLLLMIVGAVATARLLLVNAVVLNERRGLGAFKRSWALTRGLTWRIIGVLLLYVIVIGVAVSAAQFITGAVFGLLLDDIRVTTFIAAVVAAVVTTIFSVIAAAFAAQLYVAVTQRGVATVFE